MKNLILIDSNALIHRAFHALPPFKTKKGMLVNSVYGFTSILFRIIQELKPDYLLATFDLEGPTFRDLEYKEYKAKRVKQSSEFYNQFPLIKELLKVMEIPIYEKKGFEADDVIGTIVEKLKGEDIRKTIITGDLDTLQLVDEKTEICTLKKGINHTFIYDTKAIKEKYGLTPDQIIDFKGLKGDPSDNIPGISGIGEKTAIQLIKQFGSLEKIYKDINKGEIKPPLQARLLEYKEDALMSKNLATIKKDVEIDFNLDDCKWNGFNKEEIKKILERLEFKSLIKRLDVI